jgi:ADP-heptose:LPS heptosyltransferase
VPVRIAQSREFGGGLLTSLVRPQPDRMHLVDRNLFLLEQAGLPVAGRQLELRIPDEAEQVAGELLARSGIADGDPYVVLNPGTDVPGPPDGAAGWAETCDELAGRLGVPIVLVGSRTEVGIGNVIVAAAPDAAVVSLAGETGVPELAAILRTAEVVVTGSGAPMHIADAFRRPVLVLAEATERESQWRPRGSAARILLRPARGGPRLPDQPDLTPAIIAEEVAALLDVPQRHLGPVPPVPPGVFGPPPEQAGQPELPELPDEQSPFTDS